MKLIDISPTISENIAVFPGDRRFERQVSFSLAEGDHMDLSSVATTLHVGSHADAPCHYLKDGPSVDELDLVPYIGSCQVLTVNLAPGQRIGVHDVSPLKISAQRILFRTNSFPDPDRWNDDFNSLSAELILFLNSLGVLLVGIDTPSVDPFDSKKLEAHQALAKTNMRVLEGLCLGHVEDGFYELVALPLKIKGGEAGPVRAILREGSSS